MSKREKVIVSTNPDSVREAAFGIFSGRAEDLLSAFGKRKIDLVVSSPPYNIGKPYEQRVELSKYRIEQKKLIRKLTSKLSKDASVCWQVGNHVQNGGQTKGQIFPLDFLFHELFMDLGFKLRNRIIWRYGHGLHCKNRFSGRYETILWYTRSDEYTFNLDAVRVKSKYPAKTYFKGPKKGQLSGNPNGKNPEDVWDAGLDVWDIPNVKGNHTEKTIHPCQFPVGLTERLVLALSNPGDLVFDPYAGVSSTGVAAALHGRQFVGAEMNASYNKVGAARIRKALKGTLPFRPHTQPLYDHTQSRLSIAPPGFKV